jgi:hypothetical protein
VTCSIGGLVLSRLPLRMHTCIALQIKRTRGEGALQQIRLYKDAIDVYDALLDRFTDATEHDLREQVARAMVGIFD